VPFLRSKATIDGANHEISAHASAWWPDRSTPFFQDRFREFCIFDSYFSHLAGFAKLAGLGVVV